MDRADCYRGVMTAALFLQILGLAALHLALSARPNHLGRRIALVVAGVATLPFAFGPFIPIAHFIFEATNRSVLWAMQGVGSLLLVALAMRLIARWRDGAETALRLPFAGILVGQTIWLVAAIVLSDHEPGQATQDVWDAPVYMFEWLAGISLCVFLALAAWRTAVSGVAFRLLIGGYLLILGLLAIGTVV